MTRMISDLQSMGFKRSDIDEAVAKVGGPAKIDAQPLATSTQEVIDAIVAKQEGERGVWWDEGLR